jgi:hypothetical protein
MTETERLISRIRALAEMTGKAPTTLSGQLLGSGASLAALEEGKTITLAKYERAMAELDALEKEARKAARAA